MSDREGNLFGLIIIAVAIAVLVVGWLLFQQRLIIGVEAGLLVGLVVGSIFWPVVRTPDLGGRALIGGFLGILLILLFEVLRIGDVFRDANLLRLESVSLLGGNVYAIAIRILQAAYVGAAIAVVLVSPAHFAIGAIVGSFIAAAIGGIGLPLLAMQGIVLPREVVWLGVGLITLAIFVVFDSA